MARETVPAAMAEPSSDAADSCSGQSDHGATASIARTRQADRDRAECRAARLGAHFRMGDASRQFVQIDSYVYERLALFLSKKTGRSGRRWKIHTRDFFRALGVYHLSGTVAWTTATSTAAR